MGAMEPIRRVTGVKARREIVKHRISCSTSLQYLGCELFLICWKRSSKIMIEKHMIEKLLHRLFQKISAKVFLSPN